MNSLRPVLLVEDNPLDVELTLAAFKEFHLVNDIVCINNGEEALDFLYCRGIFTERQAGNPILILLDLKMPKVDGLEVLRQIKSDPNLRSVPVVMLTSSKEESDLVKSYQLGVNAYVVKPVEFDEFMEAIKKLGVFWAVLNEPPPLTAAPIAF